MLKLNMRNAGLTFSAWTIWFYAVSLLGGVVMLVVMENNDLFYLATGLVELLLAAPALAYYAMAGKSARDILGPKSNLLQWLCVVGIALVLVPALVWISMLGNSIIVLLGGTPVASDMPPTDNLFTLVLAMVMIGGTAAVAEEPLFRGVLLQGMGPRLGKGPTLVLTALFFAMAHGSPNGLPTLFVAGLLLGYVRYETGSLVPCLILHGVYNAAAVLFDHLILRFADRLPAALTGIDAVTGGQMLYVTAMWALLAIPCAALLVLLFLGLRKATPAQNRLPKQPAESYPIGAGTVLAYLPAVGICALLLMTMLLGCFMPL